MQRQDSSSWVKIEGQSEIEEEQVDVAILISLILEQKRMKDVASNERCKIR